MFCFVTVFEYCLWKCQWDVQPLINILTYNLNVLIKVLNPGLKKLHVDSLVVPNGVIFLKPRPLVKWNNGKFRHASCFTFLICSVHFTLSGMILLDPPTSNNFVQFVFAKIPRESAWWVLYRPPGIPGRCNSSKLNSFRFWNFDIRVLATLCRKFLYVVCV